MIIKAHLTDEELAQAWSEPSRTIAVHLEDCEACRTELLRLRHGLTRHDEAGEEFWQQQRRDTWKRIDDARVAPHSSGLRWGLASAALILLAAMLSMNSGNRPPQPKPVVAETDPDHELLLEVERIVQSNGPIALEPAGLMTQTQWKQDPIVTSKESNHEN